MKALALLEKRLAADALFAAIDPATFALIITAIMTMLQQCREPQPKALRRRLFHRRRLIVHLRGQTGLDWDICDAQATRIFDLADKASDEELQTLIDDCCGE